jgi:hypothetical protein
MGFDISLPFVIAAHLLLVKVTADCTQFTTNGSTAANYEFYRFYDFRNIDNTGDESTFAASNERCKTFSSAPWNTGWNSRSWARPATRDLYIDMDYVPSGVFISQLLLLLLLLHQVLYTTGNNTDASQEFSTYLTLYTTRLPNGTQLAAALDYSEYNVTHASIRMSARVHGGSGAVAGLFTYYNDTTESDIEVLTRDPEAQVRYSNQPTADPQTEEPIPGSSYNVSLASGRSTSTWNDYRLDLVPGRSAWYANGAQTATTEVNVPDTASKVTLNSWSNGGTFSGRMEIGEEAWFDVQWIELLFNTSSSADSQSEGSVCSAEASSGTLKQLVRSNTSPLLGRQTVKAYIFSIFTMLLG